MPPASAGARPASGRQDGSADVARAVDRLARRLPEPLAGLARVAYNYRWTWAPGGRELFVALDRRRFVLASENPIRFLRDLPETRLLEAATDPGYLARLRAVLGALDDDLARPPTAVGVDGRPVAFLCAEFGVHASLPVYSGGLGVLAGDLLKEASDGGYPFIGVGLLYRRGYFHQRLDLSGLQHEYWLELDPETLPIVRVSGADGAPLTVTVPVWDTEVPLQVWRADLGRVPLYLLDAGLPENRPLERWITARLYEGNRAIRLAQYSALGLGAVRALAAMGIEPALYHLNEGHAALAAVELCARAAPPGTPLVDALAAVRERLVFTTHTPVAAGNETYSRDELLSALGGAAARLRFDPEELLRAGRVHPDDPGEPAGLTPLAIRASRSVNGVSRRHGAVARAMWHPLHPLRSAEEVPIGHVTNGVHLPTWMAPEMRALLDRYLEPGWERRTDEEGWAGIDAVPDEELWAVRNELRSQLVERLRRRAVTDRLARGEPLDVVLSAETALDPGTLTLGFGRRLAAYKRLDLLVHDPERVLGILRAEPPLQLVLAGKAHPLDDGAKAITQRLFALRRDAAIAGRVVYAEDYDLRLAPTLVSGCDVWVNLPRPPLEASGTSGMKAALNGALALSVLDGWWAEAYDGRNGFAIDGSVEPDEAAQDARDAAALYDLVEREVRPLFYDRDEHGVPRGWTALMKASLRSIGPRFSATRMLDGYVRDVYAAAPSPPAARKPVRTDS